MHVQRLCMCMLMFSCHRVLCFVSMSVFHAHGLGHGHGLHVHIHVFMFIFMFMFMSCSRMLMLMFMCMSCSCLVAHSLRGLASAFSSLDALKVPISRLIRCNENRNTLRTPIDAVVISSGKTV